MTESISSFLYFYEKNEKHPRKNTLSYARLANNLGLYGVSTKPHAPMNDVNYLYFISMFNTVEQHPKFDQFTLALFFVIIIITHGLNRKVNFTC